MAITTRAADFKSRAAKIDEEIKKLPPEAHDAARERQKGFEQLAAMEEWIAVPPKAKSQKFDYNLEPRTPKPVKIRTHKSGRPAKERG